MLNLSDENPVCVGEGMGGSEWWGGREGERWLQPWGHQCSARLGAGVPVQASIAHK